MWTALLDKHVKINPYLFIFVLRSCTLCGQKTLQPLVREWCSDFNAVCRKISHLLVFCWCVQPSACDTFVNKWWHQTMLTNYPVPSQSYCSHGCCPPLMSTCFMTVCHDNIWYCDFLGIMIGWFSTPVTVACLILPPTWIIPSESRKQSNFHKLLDLGIVLSQLCDLITERASLSCTSNAIWYDLNITNSLLTQDFMPMFDNIQFRYLDIQIINEGVYEAHRSYTLVMKI